MAKALKSSSAGTGPALVTKIVTYSDSDQAAILKSVQNMDTSPGDVKLRNASDDSDVTITIPAWGRLDGYYSRVWSTGTTLAAGKLIGFYDTPS